MLSIAINHVKLHISVPEKRWFKIRKVAGITGAIISKDGKDVDINVGELRFGERRDLLVEVEMSNEYASRALSGEGAEAQTATDAFFMSTAGLDPASIGHLGGASLYEDEYESMPEEVALFEVTAAYRDPAARKTVAHVSNTPTLLTITVNPANYLQQANESRKSATAPEIVKRRIELLVSDMLTKALLFSSCPFLSPFSI